MVPGFHEIWTLLQLGRRTIRMRFCIRICQSYLFTPTCNRFITRFILLQSHTSNKHQENLYLAPPQYFKSSRHSTTFHLTLPTVSVMTRGRRAEREMCCRLRDFTVEKLSGRGGEGGVENQSNNNSVKHWPNITA